MTAKQEAKLGMYDNILQHCADNPATVALILAFSNGAASLDAVAIGIKAAATIQAAKGTGAETKRTSKEDLCKLTLTNANATYAYAISINDGDLANDVKFTLSGLKKIKDENIASTCQVVYDRAFANKTDLVNFGLTNAIIASLQTAINSYSGKITAPATIKAHKKTAGQDIKQLFKDGDKALKTQMDKTVGLLAASDAEFVKDYYNLRGIVDPATRHTSIGGTITDKLTDLPLGPDSYLFVEELGKKFHCNAKGVFNTGIIEPGTYVCIAHGGEGYDDVRFEAVVVKLGKKTRLKIELIHQ